MSEVVICDSPDVYLVCEGVGLLSELVFGKEHIHVTVTATEQVRDEASVQALADAARATVKKARTDVDASQRQTYCSELALQGGRVVKEGGPEELLAAVTGSPAGCSMERYTLL